MAREKKESEIKVRVTPTQREKWKRAAEADGRSLSSLVCHVVDLFAAKVLRRRGD